MKRKLIFYKRQRSLLPILLPLLLLCLGASAQAPEYYAAPLANTGNTSHLVGTGSNAFTIPTGGSYEAFIYGSGTDAFLGPNGVAGIQAIAGGVAPNFGTLSLNNGAASAFNITNTLGIKINTTLTFGNGITTTLRSSRAVGLAGAIQFMVAATYTPALSPAIGADTRFVDGYVSKVNPAAFVYPVGNGIDLRTISATGTGTFATAWSTGSAITAYPGALPGGVTSLATNGYWEWSGTAAATVTVSIPNESALGAASGLTILGYNGTAWINLGGVFATNTENSSNTAAVSVPSNITALTIGAASSNVTVNAKVFLQGDMGAGATMNNDLQNYFGGNSGLLPTTSPYGGTVATDATINNPAGLAGTVADWITVEVRLASNSYATAAETKYLLVKPDGTVEDATGAVPTFTAQIGTVRLVIKHRNHLAVMSNNIASFTSGSTVNYDFSSSLGQASNVFGDPAQMVQVNGKWCLWAGDLDGDGFIDNSDYSTMLTNSNALLFDVYHISDVTLDGFVDNSDYSTLLPNSNALYYSTLVNY